jgi:hypothetical protein
VKPTLKVRDYLRTCGFLASNADPNLFVRRGVSILLYVDDMLVVGKRSDFDAAKALIRHKWKCKALIRHKWKCKDLKEAKLFVGFQIDRDRKAKSLKIH